MKKVCEDCCVRFKISAKENFRWLFNAGGKDECYICGDKPIKLATVDMLQKKLSKES